jgi:hypothetical protein|tara:strand:- start:190 stop:492 length:303 start_codon:yes stop_codon:yes gene_type:complete
MSQLFVDHVTNTTGDSPVDFPNGVNISSRLEITQGLNITGVITCSAIDISTDNINITGVATATSFSGDGSGITNLDQVTATIGEIFAMRYLFSYQECFSS